MGNRGKTWEQQRARELRGASWTLADIAAELGVAKSSVSRWVRDVSFVPSPRHTARNRAPNRLQRAKAAEIEQFRVAGLKRFQQTSDAEFLAAGLGLYAGDGAKRGSAVHFANSSRDLVVFFCRSLREFFEIDEGRLRVQLYLHADLDLAAAEHHWSLATNIPTGQFHKAYRAEVDSTRRHNRHEFGCCHVKYSSTHLLREILGLVDGLIRA